MNIHMYNAHQIGGVWVQITSNSGCNIMVDVGKNLPSLNKEKRPDLDVEGLTYGKPNFDAVLVTHTHEDHVGLYTKVLPEIPIYVGEISKNIYKIVKQRLNKAKIASNEELEKIESFIEYKIPKKIKIKDIVITPIECDHSSFCSHMFLIECDGKKILHTGDWRLTGQRGKAVIPAIKKYVGKVDYLICEGTTLSRNEEQPLTEMQLQYKAENIFKKNKYTFVLCSSTNIDRIAAIHKAALKANRLFVCDKYQKDILMYIDSISRSSLYKFDKRVLSYSSNISHIMEEKGFVMLVRPGNYISKEVLKKFPQSKFIYSQWKGYLNPNFKEYKYIQDFVPEDYIYLHTSGHADKEAIKKLIDTVEPEYIIPIHTEKPEEFENIGTYGNKILTKSCNFIQVNS